jgi:hypothetical protein
MFLSKIRIDICGKNDEVCLNFEDKTHNFQEMPDV